MCHSCNTTTVNVAICEFDRAFAFKPSEDPYELSEAEVEGRWAARKAIDEVRDRLQRQADGTADEARYAAYAGR